MLWKLRPLNRPLSLMVILWIVISLIAVSILALVMRAKDRNLNAHKGILIPLPKNASASQRIRLVTRVK